MKRKRRASSQSESLKHRRRRRSQRHQTATSSKSSHSNSEQQQASVKSGRKRRQSHSSSSIDSKTKRMTEYPRRRRGQKIRPNSPENQNEKGETLKRREDRNLLKKTEYCRSESAEEDSRKTSDNGEGDRIENEDQGSLTISKFDTMRYRSSSPPRRRPPGILPYEDMEVEIIEENPPALNFDSENDESDSNMEIETGEDAVVELGPGQIRSWSSPCQQKGILKIRKTTYPDPGTGERKRKKSIRFSKKVIVKYYKADLSVANILLKKYGRKELYHPSKKKETRSRRRNKQSDRNKKRE